MEFLEQLSIFIDMRGRTRTETIEFICITYNIKMSIATWIFSLLCKVGIVTKKNGIYHYSTDNEFIKELAVKLATPTSLLDLKEFIGKYAASYKDNAPGFLRKVGLLKKTDVKMYIMG